MLLSYVDWTIIVSFLLISLFIGIYSSRKAGKSSTEFFAAGKGMPWWLLGISMVATTFSTDTPNLVTDIVRQHGIAGNWLWWAFLLTGMLTVFIYAQLWKRSGILTDIEFYEIRYSGKMAAFLRGFRAIYLGFFFNIMIMATVTLAAIKITGVLMGLNPVQTIIIAGTITVVYSALGGLRGVLLTDFLLFFLSIGGGLIAAIVSVNLPQVGGLDNLLNHASVQDKLNLLPDFSNPGEMLTIFLIPILVQWWSVWYPGAEPGGGGYIAQRMLSAKNEKNAVGAVFLFNAAHYALRPWPWIIVALASIIIFPDLSSLQQAFPGTEGIAQHDMSYPAMLTFIPSGLLGIVVASLVAAYMSTISTHLNWGSSYIVNDFYKRFARPAASEKELVFVGRASTVILMIIAGFVALLMENALDSFQILLQIGAGTGLLFILRWFWWRINAYSELSAMIISFLVAVYFQFVHPYTGLPLLEPWQELVSAVIITTIGWISITFLTRKTEFKTLVRFYKLVYPGGPGWKKIVVQMKKSGIPESDKYSTAWHVPRGILCMLVGTLSVYSALFASGYWINGLHSYAFVLTLLTIITSILLIKLWAGLLRPKLKEQNQKVN
jgi:Na+/proline symporter